MSGGDFMSRSEGAICTRRGIDDRVTVVRDLQRVIARHGDVGATDQLGCEAGYLAKVIDRKKEIAPALLLAMYGVAGAKLVRGLAATPGIDADVAKVLAAARGEELVKHAEDSEPAAANPPPWRREVDPTDAGHRELVAVLKRAVEAFGSNRQAAGYFGWGLSTLGFLKAGNRAFSGAQADKLRTWAAANPEQDASAAAPRAADDRGAEEVPPPAPVYPDTADRATDAVPPAPVAAAVSAVAAAPAAPPLADVAPPPIVSTGADIGTDTIGKAVLMLQSEDAQLVAACGELRAQLASLESQRGKVMRAIEALQAVAA
jgi:hypothetical protein